jgi:hypothetical protein
MEDIVTVGHDRCGFGRSAIHHLVGGSVIDSLTAGRGDRPVTPSTGATVFKANNGLEEHCTQPLAGLERDDVVTWERWHAADVDMDPGHSASPDNVSERKMQKHPKGILQAKPAARFPRVAVSAAPLPSEIEAARLALMNRT